VVFPVPFLAIKTVAANFDSKEMFR